MAENSKIEWTKHTCNLWHGCTAVHEGCDHCYAEVLNKRWGHQNWGNDAPRRLINSHIKDFRRFNEAAEQVGEIHSVFVGSMMDIGEKPMPLIDSKGNPLDFTTGTVRDQYFINIVRNTPHLLHLLLSKRPGNYNKYTPTRWKLDPPDNVMFGTSPVSQKTADVLIPQLLQVPGRRFLSIEPQLGPVDLRKVYNGMSKPLDGINWVIVGGESGPHKRPFDPDWARDIRDACAEARVPFFMKQWDKVRPIPEDLMIREFPR